MNKKDIMILIVWALIVYGCAVFWLKIIWEMMPLLGL